MRHFGIKSRTRELETVGEAISVVEGKIKDMLKVTGCKSYVDYAKHSNEAEHNHELKNKQLEAQSRNVFFEVLNTAYRKMIVQIFTTDNQQYRAASHTIYAKQHTSNKHNIKIIGLSCG